MRLFKKAKERASEGGYAYLPQIPRQDWFPLTRRGVQFPRVFYNPLVQYHIFLICSDWFSTIFKQIQRVLSGGLDVEARFVSKCESCGAEQQTSVDVCPVCGSDQLRPPSASDEKFLKRLLEIKANRSGETLHFILLQFLMCLDIFDDAYLVILKDYEIDENTGKIGAERPMEIYAGSPIFMRIIADERQVIGGKYFCLAHRQTLYDKPGKCSSCGLPLREAAYGAAETPVSFESLETHYMASEIVHASIFCPTRTYGISPLLPLWNKISSLIYMDKLIESSFRYGRSPQGLIWATTANPAAFFKVWEDIRKRLVEDPQYIPCIAFPTLGTGGEEKSKIEYMRVGETPKELGLLELRNEYRRAIAAFYGISSIAINDIEGLRGWQSERAQLKQEELQIEVVVNLLNSYVLPSLLRNMRVTDWNLQVASAIPEDEDKELTIKIKEATLARSLLEVGLEVKYTAEGKFEVSEGLLKLPSPTPGEGLFESEDDLETFLEETQKKIWERRISENQAT